MWTKNYRVRINKRILNKSRYGKIENNINVDITEAICEAYRRIEEENEIKRKEDINKTNKEWNQVIGIKEFQETGCRIKDSFKRTLNDFLVFKNILIFKEENVKNIEATISLFKCCTVVIFSLVKWLLYIISIAIFCLSISNKINVIFLLPMCILSLMLARVIRIAIFEIYKLSDDNLITNIFSGCIAFVALIIAIISLFK